MMTLPQITHMHSPHAYTGALYPLNKFLFKPILHKMKYRQGVNFGSWQYFDKIANI